MTVFINVKEITFLQSSSSNPIQCSKWLCIKSCYPWMYHIIFYNIYLLLCILFWITVEWTYFGVLFHGPVGEYTVTQCRFQVVIIWFLCIPVRRLSLSFFLRFNCLSLHSLNGKKSLFGQTVIRSNSMQVRFYLFFFKKNVFHCNHFRVIPGIIRQHYKLFHLSQTIIRTNNLYDQCIEINCENTNFFVHH